MVNAEGTGSEPEPQLADVAELVTWLVLRREPTLGSTRLLCVDGPAGSGKTTLGRAVAAHAGRLGSVRLVHMDDLYEGWGGLGDVADRVARDLVAPLRRDEPGRYQRYDWHRGRFAEWHTVEPVDLLVLEGVGSGAACYDVAITLLVWVEAPEELRIARGVARDGDQVLPKWLAWMDSEQAVFRRDDTRDRADVVVDGSGRSPHAVTFE